MAYEMRDGQGSLFKNDRKTEDRHPDYTGKVNIGGVVKRISAWVKTGGEGKKSFFSLSISEFKNDSQTQNGDLPF